jgi:peptidoglycan/xylan/chitin deacetylase (PgdA/CDA1 family)
MKVFILNRKKLMVMVGCSITAVLSCFVGIKSTVFMAKERKLPIYCVDKKEKVVSISFDAAWGNEQTQTLIDILAEKGVKATFFLVGFWAEKYPESVKAIHEAGHDVGNHSDTHPHLPKLEREKITEQIDDCNKKSKLRERRNPYYLDLRMAIITTVLSNAQTNLACTAYSGTLIA